MDALKRRLEKLEQRKEAKGRVFLLLEGDDEPETNEGDMVIVLVPVESNLDFPDA